MSESKFKIIMSCDEGYEDLCAEIFFEDQFVAIVTQEQGFDHLEIEIHSSQSGSPWTFNFSEFSETLEEAKKALWSMRKMPE